MDNIPHDPAMLLSYVNTLLRDYYASAPHPLDALCNDRGIDRAWLEDTLRAAGFEYNPSQRKFW